MKSTFKTKPSFFYSMSIAATWAGAGSFIVGTQIAKEIGLIPWILWALGNTLTCIVFGLVATKFKIWMMTITKKRMSRSSEETQRRDRSGLCRIIY